jgi:hypothetical protein
MSLRSLLLIIGIAIFFYGCQTTQSNRPVTRQDIDAVKRVASEIAGREVSEEELYRLGKMMQANAQTQEAVGVITNTLTQKPIIKYCPVDGKRFAPNITICPQHNVELKVLED